MHWIILAVTPLLLLSCSQREKKAADDPLIASIDSVVKSAADTARFNGNVLVSRDGKIIYQRSFGYANFDTREVLNDSSVFELASVSKQFTAMGIMMLKERGKLNYSDDVRRYISELPYADMTIRHFLNHTSGIPDYMEQFSKGWDPNAIAYNEDIVKLLARNKPDVLFKPGEKWEYSNTAYALLATIIERVSGKAYGEFLAENIFAPLNMTHSRTYNTRRSKGEVIPNYAYGFVYSDSLKKYFLPDSVKELRFVFTFDGIQGDGIVNSTTGDLFKWDQALYTEKLVSQNTLQEAFTPGRLNDNSLTTYGFGWGIGKDSISGKFVDHSGGWPGYITYIKRYIDKNNTIIVLTNNNGSGSSTVMDNLNRLLGQ